MTLHHVEDPISLLQEMRRVLIDTGKIYLIDITYRKKFFGFVLNKIKCPEPYHFEKFYSEEEISNMLNGIDLCLEKAQRITIFPTTSIIMPVTIFELKLK